MVREKNAFRKKTEGKKNISYKRGMKGKERKNKLNYSNQLKLCQIKSSKMKIKNIIKGSIQLKIFLFKNKKYMFLKVN